MTLQADVLPGAPRLQPSWKSLLVPLAMVIAGAVAVYFALPPHGLYADDEGVKYIQMRSFVANRWSAITVPYPGSPLDPNLEWVGSQRKFAVFDGKLHTTYPLLFALLSSLLYPLLGDRVVHFLPLLSYVLSSAILGRTLSRFVEHKRFLCVLVLGFAFASPVVLYSVTFWEHLPAVLLVVVAAHFMTLYFHHSAQARYLLLSVFFVSLGVFFRSEVFVLLVAYLAALCLVLRQQRRSQHIGGALLGASLPLAAFGGMNFALYHNPLGLHVLYNRAPFPPLRIACAFIAFFGIFVFIYARERRNARERQSLLLVFPMLWLGYLLVLLSSSPVPRLFIEFPACILLLISTLSMGTTPVPRASLQRVIVGTFVGFVSLMGLLFYDNPHRDVRYLVVIIPLVFHYLAVIAPQVTGRKALFSLLLALLAISVVTNGYRLTTDILKFKNYNQARYEFLASHTEPGDVLIFNATPLLEHAGPLYFDRVMFVAGNMDRLEMILQSLQQQGVSSAFFWTLDAQATVEWLELREDHYDLLSQSAFQEYHTLFEIGLRSSLAPDKVGDRQRLPCLQRPGPGKCQTDPGQGLPTPVAGHCATRPRSLVRLR